ncbi:hypothetical protein HXX76_011768 [Chlamydomonas incerta]|uniref:Uncharacterized protein n=1 Tax=Chlamydomonas incerta TaxID=51695 RepID=A0A835SN20_CHLIN|nr:hypothetical protein HXX76_011768 [Chlamydomonas incerta]|eukprot:KAG2426543.1 hypothetical protein HXX76_011768 [Chlamydomonas incerta]
MLKQAYLGPAQPLRRQQAPGEEGERPRFTPEQGPQIFILPVGENNNSDSITHFERFQPAALRENPDAQVEPLGTPTWGLLQSTGTEFKTSGKLIRGLGRGEIMLLVKPGTAYLKKLREKDKQQAEAARAAAAGAAGAGAGPSGSAPAADGAGAAGGAAAPAARAEAGSSASGAAAVEANGAKPARVTRGRASAATSATAAVETEPSANPASPAGGKGKGKGRKKAAEEPEAATAAAAAEEEDEKENQQADVDDSRKKRRKVEKMGKQDSPAADAATEDASAGEADHVEQAETEEAAEQPQAAAEPAEKGGLAEQWEERYGQQAVVVAIGVVTAVHADQEERCTELYGTGKVYCPGKYRQNTAVKGKYKLVPFHWLIEFEEVVPVAIPREQVAHDLGLLSETGQSYHWQKGQYLNRKNTKPECHGALQHYYDTAQRLLQAAREHRAAHAGARLPMEPDLDFPAAPGGGFLGFCRRKEEEDKQVAAELEERERKHEREASDEEEEGGGSGAEEGGSGRRSRRLRPRKEVKSYADLAGVQQRGPRGAAAAAAAAAAGEQDPVAAPAIEAGEAAPAAGSTAQEPAAAAPAGPSALASCRGRAASAGPVSSGPLANGSAPAGKPNGPAATGAAAANGPGSNGSNGATGAIGAPVANGPGRPPAGPRKPKGAAAAMVGGALVAAAGAGQTPEQQAAAFSNQPAIQQLCMQVAQAAAHAAGLAAAKEQEVIRAERDRLAETVARLRAQMGDNCKAGGSAPSGDGAPAAAPTSSGEYSDAREGPDAAEDGGAGGPGGAAGKVLSAAAQLELLRAQLAVEREERRRQAEAEAAARSELARAMEELHALRASRLGPVPDPVAVAGAPALVPAAAVAEQATAGAPGVVAPSAPMDTAAAAADNGPVRMEE